MLSVMENVRVSVVEQTSELDFSTGASATSFAQLTSIKGLPFSLPEGMRMEPHVLVESVLGGYSLTCNHDLLLADGLAEDAVKEEVTAWLSSKPGSERVSIFFKE